MQRRIFIPSKNINNDSITFDKDSEKHIFTVLRLTKDSHFTAYDGEGKEYTAVIKDKKNAFIIAQREIIDEGRKIHLYLSLIRQSRLENALEKCTELGASTFTFLNTERSQDLSLTASREKRFQTVTEQAARQSIRAQIPKITGLLSFEEALIKTKGNLSLIGSFASSSSSWKALIPKLLPEVNVLIGPEGGFTESELNLAKAAGMTEVNLGSSVLRSETAAIAFCSLLKYS